MPFGIGPTELIILLIVVLLLFGAKRVPEIGRSVGKGMREFKDAVTVGTTSSRRGCRECLATRSASPRPRASASATLF